MAGGECSLRRCTAKSVEASASASAAGPQASLRRCSTKRKAAAAGGRKAKKQGDAASSTDAAAAAAGVKNWLSDKEIRWILSRKPCPPPRRYEALKRRNPELVPLPGEEDDEEMMTLYYLTKAFYEMEEEKPKLKEWVRGELASKGYVEVDDEYHKRKDEAQARVDRAWPEMEAIIKNICRREVRCGVCKENQIDSSDGEEDSWDE